MTALPWACYSHFRPVQTHRDGSAAELVSEQHAAKLICLSGLAEKFAPNAHATAAGSCRFLYDPVPEELFVGNLPSVSNNTVNNEIIISAKRHQGWHAAQAPSSRNLSHVGGIELNLGIVDAI